MGGERRKKQRELLKAIFLQIVFIFIITFSDRQHGAFHNWPSEIT